MIYIADGLKNIINLECLKLNLRYNNLDKNI